MPISDLASVFFTTSKHIFLYVILCMFCIYLKQSIIQQRGCNDQIQNRKSNVYITYLVIPIGYNLILRIP